MKVEVERSTPNYSESVYLPPGIHESDEETETDDEQLEESLKEGLRLQVSNEIKATFRDYWREFLRANDQIMLAIKEEEEYFIKREAYKTWQMMLGDALGELEEMHHKVGRIHDKMTRYKPQIEKTALTRKKIPELEEMEDKFRIR